MHSDILSLCILVSPMCVFLYLASACACGGLSTIHTIQGEMDFYITGVSFSQGVTISHLLREIQLHPLFIPLHLSLVVGQSGLVVWLWPQPPVGNENVCSPPFLKLATCFTSMLALNLHRQLLNIPQEILAFLLVLVFLL